MNRVLDFKPTRFAIVPLRVWIEVGVISLLGMESLWLTGYYRYLSHIELGFGPAALFLFCLGLTSHYLARGLNHLGERHPGWARLVLLLWLLAGLLLALKLMVFPFRDASLGEIAGSPVMALLTQGRDAREFWTLAFSLGAMVRGIGLARRSAGRSGILFSFQAGLFLLLIFGWLLAPELRAQAIFCLVLMIFLGLVSIFSYKMVRRIEGFGNQASALDTWWARHMFLSALLEAFGGAAAGWLLALAAPLLMQALWTVVKLVVGAAALLIVTIVQWVVQLILELLRATNLDQLGSDLYKRIQQISQQISVWSEENIRTTDDPVNILLWILIAAALLGLLLFFIIKRWKAAAARTSAAGREDWTQLLKNPAERPVQFSARRPPRRMQAAERVRFLYAQLMELCERLEMPRGAAVTPLEFLPTLEDLFPENKPEAALLTHAYQRVRYGQFPEEKEHLREVTHAWEELARAGEKLYLAKKKMNRFQKL